MSAVIDYYFFSASPFTYLGHDAIRDVAKAHGAELNYKPVNLFDVWEVSGAVPPPKRPPVRQRYRLVEIERIAAFRGLPVNPKPAHFPVDATLADLTVAALVDDGVDAGDYMASLFRAVWADEKNIADEAVLAELLSQHGQDASAVLEKAKSEPVAAIRAQNTKDAVASDAVGVPAYVLNGEVFWGQDRVEHVAHALETGRKPVVLAAD